MENIEKRNLPLSLTLTRSLQLIVHIQDKYQTGMESLTILILLSNTKMEKHIFSNKENITASMMRSLSWTKKLILHFLGSLDSGGLAAIPTAIVSD